MRVLHETILRERTSSLSIRDFDLPVFDCPYHRHQEFEVLRIDESRGRVLAGDFMGRFESGEIYVFGGRLPHAFINVKGTGRARSRCLQFDADQLFQSIGGWPEFDSVERFLNRAGRGLRLSGPGAGDASRVLDEVFASSGLLQVAEVLKLLGTLEASGELSVLASEGYLAQTPDRHLEQLERALTHIHEESAKPLAIAQLARMCGMSETSFHRHFRQRIGRTPHAYLQEVRLSNVAQRLLESSSSISEIAFSEGFNNLSNFNHQFQRRFACTPRDYRARHAALQGES